VTYTENCKTDTCSDSSCQVNTLLILGSCLIEPEKVYEWPPNCSEEAKIEISLNEIRKRIGEITGELDIQQRYDGFERHVLTRARQEFCKLHQNSLRYVLISNKRKSSSKKQTELDPIKDRENDGKKDDEESDKKGKIIRKKKREKKRGCKKENEKKTL